MGLAGVPPGSVSHPSRLMCEHTKAAAGLTVAAGTSPSPD